MLLQPQRGALQVALRNDVIAIKNRPGAMLGKLHRDLLGDARLDQVTHATSPEVVHEHMAQPRSAAGMSPAFTE